MTPYYEREGITIYHGDCREILPQLDPVDLDEIDSRESCACPSCRVVVRVESAPCGHRLCEFCRKPDHLCEACHPDDPWTEERCREYLLHCYFAEWQLEHAEKDFDAMRSHIQSSSYGASGPHRPSFQTEGPRVKFWSPQTKWTSGPDAIFTIASLLREALNRRANARALLEAEAGTYAGPAKQAVLL